MGAFGATGDPVDGVSQVLAALPDAEGPADGAEGAEDARRSIGRWREDYNSLRPHSSLGRMTPTEFGEESRSEEVDQPPLQVTHRVPLELG